ncbi:hypothetical protein OIE68_00410 [Nocardia vinacea]|uniref:hypothetical protein n=1 Tax=Nocardia vinacea TaxID=96468 RepID=UPI002E0DEB10|nr:hypothetical protein OIE68_00410 [Nocardia vinacea]
MRLRYERSVRRLVATGAGVDESHRQQHTADAGVTNDGVVVHDADVVVSAGV